MCCRVGRGGTLRWGDVSCRGRTVRRLGCTQARATTAAYLAAKRNILLITLLCKSLPFFLSPLRANPSISVPQECRGECFHRGGGERSNFCECFAPLQRECGGGAPKQVEAAWSFSSCDFPELRHKSTNCIPVPTFTHRTRPGVCLSQS